MDHARSARAVLAGPWLTRKYRRRLSNQYFGRRWLERLVSVTPELWPTRWTTRDAGTYQHGQPARAARRQKSTSSKYMKYASSSRPIASNTSRRMIMLAPATQSVRNGSVPGGTGGA